MHPEAMDFLYRARDLITQRTSKPISDMTVLEIGSYNVNGSAREVFGDALWYIGVDRVAGPGVDVVSDVRTYMPTNADGSPMKFDIVISTEAMEHDPKPDQIMDHANRLLADDGFLVLTAAAPPRMPHGCMGTPYLPAGEYYSNVHPDALKVWLAGKFASNDIDGSAWWTSVDRPFVWWDTMMFEYDSKRGDVYVLAQVVRYDEQYGVSKEEVEASDDNVSSVPPIADGAGTS